MNTTALIIAIAVIVLAAAAIAFYFSNRSRRLRSKFGPEYSRAVEETGSKYKAESRLEKLERRVEKFSIRPLPVHEAERFRDSWRAIQASFVDNPNEALNSADQLVGEVMLARGYPVADFEERAAEVSVHHALVVDHYRSGHDIAIRNAQGRATTEELRQAMIHYRTLFDDLLEAPETVQVRRAAAGGAR